MATHGKTREMVIASLEGKKPFKTSGSFSAVEGAVESFGQLPKEFAEDYMIEVKNDDVIYTVLSYKTPIAWVLRDGTVTIPAVKYSQTTTQQQTMCRVYL